MGISSRNRLSDAPGGCGHGPQPEPLASGGPVDVAPPASVPRVGPLGTRREGPLVSGYILPHTGPDVGGLLSPRVGG